MDKCLRLLQFMSQTTNPCFEYMLVWIPPLDRFFPGQVTIRICSTSWATIRTQTSARCSESFLMRVITWKYLDPTGESIPDTAAVQDH